MAGTTTGRSRWLVLIQLAITNQKRASVERGCSKVLTFSQRSETAPWIRQDPKPLRTPAGTANFGGVAGSTSLTGTHQANCSVWSKMLPDDFRTLGQLEGHHCRGIRRDCRFTTSGTGPSRPPTPRYARPPQMAADTDVTADSKCIERPSPRWFSARRASMGPRSIDRGPIEARRAENQRGDGLSMHLLSAVTSVSAAICGGRAYRGVGGRDGPVPDVVKRQSLLIPRQLWPSSCPKVRKSSGSILLH